MKMLGDCELFAQLCGNCNIPAPPEILEKIKIASESGELRLSSMSIVVPICEILARVLASSSTIRKVDLSDCMLLSKGLSSILNALSEGSNVTSLSLKGNNICGPTVGQLGKIFIRNNTLKRLSLEWNSLGTDVDEFGKFCDGLGVNHNIEELDLRYNQISPRCSESLAKALRANKSLRVVDLAWNTLGLRGGELLLGAIRENRGITRLNLRGNCIPEEIVYSIDESIHNNQCQSLVSQAVIVEGCSKIADFHEIVTDQSSNFLENNLLTKESLNCRSKVRVSKDSPGNESEVDNSVQTTKIVETGCEEDEASPKTGKSLEPNDKIIELNRMLQDRGAAIESLTKDIAARAEDSEAARSLVKQLENEIRLLKEERETLGAEKSREIAELREIREKSDDHWQKEYKRLEESLGEALSREKELEARVQRYEREIRKSSSEAKALKEKTLSQIQSYEDLVGKSRVELHRARREIRERENRHRIETNVLKNTLKESTEALEDCQHQLQKSRAELRETVENLATSRVRLTDLERHNSRLTRIEDSHEKLKDEKKILEEKLLDSQRIVDTLQRRVTKLQGELIEPQRRYDLVKDELEQERERNGRLKLELAEERSRQQELNSQIQTLNAQITALNNRINEIENSHTEIMRERDKERKILKDAITNKERDFNEFKTEEVQRASQLYAAFSKYYLGSFGPNTTS